MGTLENILRTNDTSQSNKICVSFLNNHSDKRTNNYFIRQYNIAELRDCNVVFFHSYSKDRPLNFKKRLT